MSLRDTSPDARLAEYESLAEAREARLRMERAFGVELTPSWQELELADAEREEARRTA